MSDVSDQRRYYEHMMDEIAIEHRQQIDQLEKQNAKLRELVKGLTWCSERGCGIGCHLYDKSEPDHCREQRLKSELGIEV